jgi:hypothetical protein
MDSYSDDLDDSSFLDISSLDRPSPIVLELSFKASVIRTRHSIRARIQVITLLELDILQLEITS